MKSYNSGPVSLVSMSVIATDLLADIKWAGGFSGILMQGDNTLKHWQGSVSEIGIFRQLLV